MDVFLVTARRPVFRPWRNARSRTTVPQLLKGTAETQKGIVEAVSKYTTRSTPRNRRREGTLGAVLAECGQIANPDVAVLAGLDN